MKPTFLNVEGLLEPVRPRHERLLCLLRQPLCVGLVVDRGARGVKPGLWAVIGYIFSLQVVSPCLRAPISPNLPVHQVPGGSSHTTFARSLPNPSLAP